MCTHLPALMLVDPDHGPQEVCWRALRDPIAPPDMDSEAAPRSLWREGMACSLLLLPRLAAAPRSLWRPSSSELDRGRIFRLLP